MVFDLIVKLAINLMPALSLAANHRPIERFWRNVS
jgi:hypothetical protein